MARIFLLILLTSSISINTSILYAQQNPSEINWKNIETGTYQIIFPEEITSLGQRVANLMVHYEKYNYSGLNTTPRKIPIVLINQLTVPNGFVSFAPYYSHWFTTPSSFDSIEWYKGLAVHEGRHMAQLSKLKDGSGKGAWRIIFGESGTAIFSSIYVPAWFFEGDAVVMETSLTKGGRGRNPYFDLWHRGLELSDQRYSYYKSYLGSYDALYPYSDHYRLGYLLCSYVRKHYGKDVWDRVLSRTGKFFLWYTFNTSLKHETGKTITELYDAALNEYRNLWKEQQRGLKITESEIISPENNGYWESFLFPSDSDSGFLTAVRFTGNKKTALINFDRNNNMRIIKQLPSAIASTFLMNERIFTTGGNFALWREDIPDPRWGYKSYSDLRLLNMKTGRTKFISQKKKFIASTLSSDGKTAAGIEYGTDLKYYLKLIDTETDTETMSEEIKDKGYIFDPTISTDGKQIALAALSDKGNSIYLFNIESKMITPLIENTHNENLRAPVFYKNYLIHGSDFSGIDNIYAIDIITKKRYQITSRPLGAYFPSVNNDTLCFNDYSIYGYKAASMKLNVKDWIPLDKADRRIINYIDSIAEQELENGNTDIDLIPDYKYSVNNYTPVLNAVNFYGWEPFFNSTSTNFYFSVFSRDVLQTTEIIISYIHNFNEKKDSGQAAIVYSGFYPVITIDSAYGGRAVYLERESSGTKPVYLTWDEVTGSGEISLPLNFSRGIHSILLNFGTETGYIGIHDKNRSDYTIYSGMNKNGYLHYMEYFLSFRHMVQGAKNSVTPGIGGILTTSFKHTPYNGDYTGSLLSGELVIYLPGLTDTQGAKIAGSYEKIKYQSYAFQQEFLFPRGYDSIRHDHLLKGTVEYSFPITSLSSNIWKLIYFKRINGTIFYDFGAGKTETQYTYYRSAGFEITTEQNLLSNINLDIEAGLRYSRCFDGHENMYEMLIKTPF